MKRLLFLLGTLFFLFGCAVSGASVPTAVPTEVAEDTHTLEPTVDIASVETEVQLTLEVMFLTLSPIVTDTPIPSETPVPTETLVPTDTSIPSPTPTFTETLIPTDTPIPTATIDSFNPNTELGAYTYQDTFEDGGNWNIYTNSQSKVEVSGGRMVYTIFSATNPTAWTLSWYQSQDFYAKVTALTGPVCAGKDAYGILFRATDASHTYFLAVSCDGQYRVVRTSAAGVVVLRHWTPNDNINSGPGQTNEFGVLMTGNVIRVYLNGVYVASIVDGTYSDIGRFGLLISSDETDNFQVAYDDFMYWKLP